MALSLFFTFSIILFLSLFSLFPKTFLFLLFPTEPSKVNFAERRTQKRRRDTHPNDTLDNDTRIIIKYATPNVQCSNAPYHYD
jgi:hypothetical protein